MIDRQGAINLVKNIIEYDKYQMTATQAHLISSYCRMVTAGIEESEHVMELRPHEQESQKIQRSRTTYSLAQYASGKILNYIRRLKSVEDVKVKFDGLESEDAAKRLNGELTDFYDNKSLLQFMIEQYADSQANDPNQLILLSHYDVMDFNGNVISRKVEPKLIPHDKIVFLQENRGVVDYGITKEERTISYNKSKTTRIEIEHIGVTDFYLYAGGMTLIFIRSSEHMQNGKDVELPPQELNNLRFEVLEAIKEDGTSEHFKVYTFINESLPCPLITTSGRIDKVDRTTKTSILTLAQNQFLELITRKSELDVTINCHVFPQKFMITPKCNYEDDRGNNCTSGYVKGKMCTACNGTGHKYHISGQDVVTIGIPNDAQPSDIPDITKMVFYAPHDQFTPQFLKTEVTGVLSTISDTTFETNIFGGVTVATNGNGQTPTNGVAQTATQVLIDWQKMYQSLKQDAEHIEKMFMLVAEYQAALIGLKTNVNCSFPKDFKFLTVDELIIEFQAAKNAKLPYDVIEKIASRLIEKLYPDDPIAMAWGLLKLRFTPFPDKTESEISKILESRGEEDHDRILWENYDTVLDELKFEKPNLIGQDYKTIKDALRAKTAEMFTTINYTQANNLDNVFNAVGN